MLVLSFYLRSDDQTAELLDSGIGHYLSYLSCIDTIIEHLGEALSTDRWIAPPPLFRLPK